MVQEPCAVLTWGFRKDIMLIVDLDSLKVISSGSIVMKIGCKGMFSKIILCARLGQTFV
jgi:hypothetical protein